MNQPLLVSETSQTTSKYVDELSPRSIEHWACVAPDDPCVVDAWGTMSFGELDDLANRFAEVLAQRGITRGDRVAVKTRMRREWVVVNRAIGKLGAEHVALNYRLTDAERAALLADSVSVALVTDDETVGGSTAAATSPSLRTTIQLGADGSSALKELTTGVDAPLRVGPDQTPMVIFTSGTTGRPKGVSFHNWLPADPEWRRRYQEAIASTPPRPPRSRVLLTLPLHHAAGPFEMTLAHQVGGCAYLLPRFDALTALELISTHRINHWMAVPTMLLRVRALPEAVRSRHDLSSLRTLYMGAAAVPQGLKEWIAAELGPDVLWEQYGSSETSAITRMDPSNQLSRPGSSGRAFPGVAIRILDEHGIECAPGTAGEIAVRTPTLIARYITGGNLPESVLSADGFFRTGDVGYLDEDGYLYITDRLKDMIISGGVNLYPAEIEAALVEHPDIVDAAVIGRPHPDLGEQPVAFLEMRDQSMTVPPDDLREFLAPRLARFKHPRGTVTVAALPRNPAGKVLKNDLRERPWPEPGSDGQK